MAATLDGGDRKSTRLNPSHVEISYAVFCLKKKKNFDRVHYKKQKGTDHPTIRKKTSSSPARSIRVTPQRHIISTSCDGCRVGGRGSRCHPESPSTCSTK